jgi:hypothetical protein
MVGGRGVLGIGMVRYAFIGRFGRRVDGGRRVTLKSVDGSP